MAKEENGVGFWSKMTKATALFDNLDTKGLY